MKRQSLTLLSLVLMVFVSILSCSKKTHELNPSLNNSRLLSVVKTSTSTTDTNSENYRFVYDGLGRVSEIFYTNNKLSVANTISHFKYVEDTVYKTITFVNLINVEIDTFITDLKGHVITSFIQGKVTNYTYFDNLLTSVRYDDTTSAIYTSYNNNFTQALSSLGTAANSIYTYYTDLENRTGDYFHLQSMFKFGMNIYQNQNMIRTITEPTYSVACNYTIDAYRKVTRTFATITDTARLVPVINEEYMIQYEAKN